MGFRFRRSIGIAKGLKLNLSKSGMSMSLGGRGASLNLGKRGPSGTIGLPGTGVSFRRQLSGTRGPSRIPSTGSATLTSPGTGFGCLGFSALIVGLVLMLTGLIIIGLPLAVLSLLFYRLRAKAIREHAEVLRQQFEARRADLIARFDEETCDRILAGEIWLGQTEEQLRESLGEPIDIDEKVMKTKRREVWKYDQTGVNRFSTRITMEDGVVSGWDRK